LEEASGDMEKAIANLRKAGIASAVKKEGRATNEGMIGSAESDKTIGLVEIGAETDFVVQNDRFRNFVMDIAAEVANTAPKSLESFIQQKYSKDNAHTIDEIRALLMQAIGENIVIKRVLAIPKKSNTSYGIYSHLGGKIVTIVEIEGSTGENDFARDIGMHIAAASPEFLSHDQVPANVIEHEKEIARSQIKGKPENIIEKIVDGKLDSFYNDNCLLRQKYIRDDSQTIAQVVEARGKEIGKPIKIVSFLRWNK